MAYIENIGGHIKVRDTWESASAINFLLDEDMPSERNLQQAQGWCISEDVNVNN